MSSESLKPVMPAYDRHIFVCVGDKCHPSQGLPVYEYLKGELKQNAADPRLKRVKRSQSKCLGVCQGGPIAVVYPDGVWYCAMNSEKMAQVIQKHLKEGQPVKEWVFYPDSSGAASQPSEK